MTFKPIIAGEERWHLAAGDALALLRELPDDCADAVVTDPPYSSGGVMRSDRNQNTDSKYTQSECLGARPDFSGDNRDGRSWLYWCALWMGECLRIVKPSGYLLTFSDWRQLPQACDAIQVGGWILRGIVTWDKGEAARPPHTGYFRHQAEFIPWGTRGVSVPCAHGGPWPGVFQVPVRHQVDKHHQTGKPTDLMLELVQIVAPGGLVLDPFAGSATTGVACLRTGRRFLGFEREPAYVDIARRRLAMEEGGVRFDGTRQRALFEAAR